MKEMFDKLDAKTITAGGGILLAALAMCMFYQYANSRALEVTTALNNTSEAMLKQANAINSLGEAVKQNNEILRALITSRMRSNDL